MIQDMLDEVFVDHEEKYVPEAWDEVRRILNNAEFDKEDEDQIDEWLVLTIQIYERIVNVLMSEKLSLSGEIAKHVAKEKQREFQKNQDILVILRAIMAIFDEVAY